MKKSAAIILIIALFAFFALASFAQSPKLYDPSNGKYLGNLNSNRFDQNSVANPYGRYGSKYSTDSINNPYGTYGSPFSNKSPNNPYATQAPVIFDTNQKIGY